MMKKILLICGSGASSGFIAQNMRKAAKAQGMEVQIKAVSDAEIEDCIEGVDLLLVGPHLRHRFPEIENSVKPLGVRVMIVNQESYAALDGEAVLRDACAALGDR